MNSIKNILIKIWHFCNKWVINTSIEVLIKKVNELNYDKFISKVGNEKDNFENLKKYLVKELKSKIKE